MKARKTLTLLAACIALACPDAEAADLISIEPDTTVPGVFVEVVITGEFEYPFSLPATVSFDPGTTILHETVFIDDTDELRTTLEIPVGTQGVHCGVHDVRVETTQYTYFGAQMFEVDCSTGTEPTIVQITPAESYTGRDLGVTIIGQDTSFEEGSSELSFSNAGISVNTSQVVSPTTLNADISVAAGAPTGTCDVIVTTGDEVAVGEDLFNVMEPPLVLSPDSGQQGSLLASVDVIGGPGNYSQSTTVDLGTGITIGGLEVLDNGASLSLLSVDIAANAPVDPHDLTMTAPGLQAQDVFTVIQGHETQLLSITPAYADRGHPALEIELVGQNTHFDDDDVTVSFSSDYIAVSGLQAVDPTHLGAEVSIGLLASEGVYDVSVELGLDGGCTSCEKVVLTEGFEVTQPGSLDDIEPIQIEAGATTDVSVSATDGQFEDGITYLVLNPPEDVVISAVSVSDANHLSATFEVAAGASGQPRTLLAVTGTEVALGVDLVDIQNPSIASIQPSSGLRGTSFPVVITGQDVIFDSGTQVSFSGDGIAVDSTSVDPEESEKITANITIAEDAPKGARDVTVVTGAIELLAPNGFQVTSFGNGDGEDSGCSCAASGPAESGLAWLFGLLLLVILPRRRG